jgi:hypothetical protein
MNKRVTRGIGRLLAGAATSRERGRFPGSENEYTIITENDCDGGEHDATHSGPVELEAIAAKPFCVSAPSFRNRDGAGYGAGRSRRLY